MALLDNLRKTLFESMKEGDENKTGILQMAVGAIKNEEIKKGSELNDEEVIRVLRGESKKLREAIEQYDAAGQVDRVARESAQLAVIEGYLPAQMSEEDVTKVVQAKMTELNVVGMADMGKLMGTVMKELSGKADGGLVKQVVTKLLSGK